MIKKILSVVVAIAFVAGAETLVSDIQCNAPLMVNALTDDNGNEYTDGTYGDLIYRNYGDHIEILGCDYSAVNVDIPAKINGIPVTVIGEYAFYHFPEEYDPYENSLVSVKIPDSVTIIGTAAFANCSKLSSINIPDSVAVIGKSAFASCSKLTEINIPKSLTSINEMSFFDCAGLTEITIPEKVKYIGDHAFMGCENLLSITIPEGVTSIGYSAFWDCDSLISVTVPKSVTSIGKDAFGSCEGLTEVTILNPNCAITGLATISNFAYYTDEATYGDFYGTIRGYDDSTAQAYAEKYIYSFKSLGEAPITLGDVDFDGIVDSADATLVLTEYSLIQTGKKGKLASLQGIAADTNKDGIIDSSDASKILVYYSDISTGKNPSWD